jgi:glycosyltransferase involved in cell wall biosynthesis
VAASIVIWHPFFMLNILGFVKSKSGCDWYRCEQPLLKIVEHQAAHVRFFNKGDDIGWFATDEAAEKIQKMFEWADIIFVPRLAEGRLITVMDHFRKLGKKVVTDWDDNIFCINPLSPSYRQFGTEEIRWKMEDGNVIDGWIDGKNIDLEKNRITQKAIVEGFSFADAFFVTGEPLKRAYTPYNSNISILPNSVDLKLWKRIPLQPHTGVRMGWFGGNSHYEDWRAIIAPLLTNFMQLNPQVTLVIMGEKWDSLLTTLDPKRVEWHPWVHIEAYPYKAVALDLDFAVIPLVDNTFNNGKSPIKWLEMGALDVPCVTSFVEPYTGLLDLVKDNGIFVEDNSASGWYEGMTLLAKDALLRKRMGEAAHETVERFYNADKTWKLWLDAFEQVKECQPPVSQLQLV